jgi:ABC-type antimicrobial peptide transport system permease subunit
LAGALLFAIWGGALAQLVFGLGVSPFLPAQYSSLANTLSLAPQFGTTTLAVLIGASVFAALGGSAWGIRQIVRLSPMEAIRHE